jgi:DNA-binding CsgD family transcriptional regulator/outer membrane lipoprotein-sorting protein
MDTKGGRRGRPPHPDILTPAEWNVLRELRKGLTNAEIAVELGISPDGVKYHVSNMLAKLVLADRHELAKWKPPRAGLRSRITSKGMLAGALGFCGVAAATIGIIAGAGVLSTGTAAPDLPEIRSTLKITTYELTETTYTAPELLSVPNSVVHSAAPAAASTDGLRQTLHAYFQAPDKARIETTSNLGDPKVELDLGGSILNWEPATGAVMKLHDPFGHTNLAVDNHGGWPANGTTLAGLMKPLTNGATVTMAGSDVVAGRPVYVVDVGAAPCPTGVPWVDGPRRYWLDKQTLFILKSEQYMSDDHEKLAASSEVTSISYNAKLDASLFEPPPGAAVTSFNPLASCGSPVATPTHTGTSTTGHKMIVGLSQCGSAVRFTSGDDAHGCPSPIPASEETPVRGPS